MPFKYRDKRNAYFKEYMRKWRAEKKIQMGETSLATSSQYEFEERKPNPDSGESKYYEVLAA